MKRRVGYLILLFLGTGWLFAQETGPLTLDELIDIGRRNSTGVRIAERRLAATRAARRGSYAGLVPSVRITARRNLTDVMDIFSGSGFEIPLRPYGSGINVDQIIFDGAQSWYDARSGAISVANAEVALDLAKQKIVLEIKEAYYGYLTNLELLRVAEEALELSRRQLGLVEERFNLQAAKETDLLKARRTVGEQERSVHQARQQLTTAATRLNVALGLEPHTPVNVARVSVVIEDNPGREEALQALTRYNPELKAQELAVEEAWLSAKKRRGVLLPRVSFSYSTNYSAEELGKLYAPVNSITNSSLNISLPLFSGLQNSSQYSSARYGALAEEERLEETERNLKARLENTLANLESFHRIQPVDKEVLASAEADVKLAEEQYNLGAISILALLDAQVSLVQARSSMVRTTYDIKIAEAQLAALMGITDR